MTSSEGSGQDTDKSSWQLPQGEVAEHDEQFEREHPEAAKRYPGTRGGK